jgi:S1-C subfamily serine protease
VQPQSSAKVSGLRQGDIIRAANRQKVTDLESLKSAVSPQQSLMLNIARGSSSLFILLN